MHLMGNLSRCCTERTSQNELLTLNGASTWYNHPNQIPLVPFTDKKTETLKTKQQSLSGVAWSPDLNSPFLSAFPPRLNTNDMQTHAKYASERCPAPSPPTSGTSSPHYLPVLTPPFSSSWRLHLSPTPTDPLVKTPIIFHVNCQPHPAPFLFFHLVIITLNPHISLPPAWWPPQKPGKHLICIFGRKQVLKMILLSWLLDWGSELSRGLCVSGFHFYSNGLNYFSEMDSRLELQGKVQNFWYTLPHCFSRRSFESACFTVSLPAPGFSTKKNFFYSSVGNDIWLYFPGYLNCIPSFLQNTASIFFRLIEGVCIFSLHRFACVRHTPSAGTEPRGWVQNGSKLFAPDCLH